MSTSAAHTTGERPERRHRKSRWLSGVLCAALLVGLIAAWYARERASERRQDFQLVEGIRKVCKLSTVEVSLADYARRTLPKKIDLPFAGASQAFLFYSGVVSAGFDVCDEPFSIRVDHSARTVHVALPPPRILSIDMKRFEIINERSALLNAIEPEDRNQWYQEARDSLERGAVGSDVLAKAQAHAQELFQSFVERWGYRVQFNAQPPPEPLVEKPRR